MNENLLAYDEVADFIANLNPAKLLELKPSSKVQERVNFLIERKKEIGLRDDEQFELDRYLSLEHLIALAKIRARAHLRA